MFCATGGTDPVPDADIFHGCFFMPATTAYLARRIPSVHPQEFLAPVLKLVAKHGEEHAITVVQRRFAVPEASVRHGFHVQVFHTHRVAPIGYLRAPLVQEVLPLVHRMAGLLEKAL